MDDMNFYYLSYAEQMEDIYGRSLSRQDEAERESKCLRFFRKEVAARLAALVFSISNAVKAALAALYSLFHGLCMGAISGEKAILLVGASQSLCHLVETLSLPIIGLLSFVYPAWGVRCDAFCLKKLEVLYEHLGKPNLYEEVGRLVDKKISSFALRIFAPIAGFYKSLLCLSFFILNLPELPLYIKKHKVDAIASIIDQFVKTVALPIFGFAALFREDLREAVYRYKTAFAN